ncbi:beta-galactosidase-like [Papaver somniferum]|uniref:beta-galactosidase-like n=1 Tax=Papaver somniferum TaxID=3469 RepID=UPI000E7002F6|nr:beta-galactosidase-like [Papaver somniferum]
MKNAELLTLIEDSIINAFNGFYCNYFTPNKKYEPKMWTQIGTGWLTGFGVAVPRRPARDVAFSVAEFIQTGGSFMNYYIFYGGANFGRTTCDPFITTSYDYDALVDEYGLLIIGFDY